ncbi:MAG TPA: peptidoglycan-associated lipoprotein Pal [Vicinamibacterales bacterium]|nr:peptidoglycan-associated lipoprotein Pal [Vicinamibacterales bacterium]
MIKSRQMWIAWALIAGLTAAACHRNKPPLARPTPPQPVNTPVETPPPNRPPAPPSPAPEPLNVPAEPVRDDAISSSSLDDINKNQVLKPVFFALDSDQLTPDAQKTLDEDGALLKKYSSWAITIEGHCDERGTAEYNLALGERRAVAARTYLVSLGIPADRLRTVSYGKEFPFDAGHDEAAWSKNRRAHFVVTAK